ncbi:hypothetical protein QOZ80_8BG0667870 [Eleusine coracana subsp. coracana]|nr:hypothetical protein QOZ80_8BG0667870 [Eleusine coracana subsp. coracana]
MAKAAAIAIIAVLAVMCFSLPGGAHVNTSFVASTCKSSDNPTCVTVLGTDRRSVNATTVRELASIGLDIATTNTRDSRGFLAGEADRHDSTKVGDVLRDCEEQYRLAVERLEAAREDFDAGRFSDAERNTEEGEDAADRCEQAFSDRHIKSTMSEVDKRMKDRTSVASDLIYLLWIVKRSGGRQSAHARLIKL